MMGRIFSYAVALEASAEHPLLGHGQGKTLMLLNFNEEMLRFDWTRAWTIDSLCTYDFSQDGCAWPNRFLLDVWAHYETCLACFSSI